METLDHLLLGDVPRPVDLLKIHVQGADAKDFSLERVDVRMMA